MYKTLILSLLLISSLKVIAQTPSLSEESFCTDRKDEKFVKDLILDSQNLMPFVNHGGIANGGVCWWHSRFQRNALYLTLYKPELPKPTKEEAAILIKKIREAKDIIVIPGFHNFSEFASAHAGKIQRELERWQKSDGVIRFAWVDGLSGSPKVKAQTLKAIMDQLYEDVEINNNISYAKLQIPGIDAHAWLVVHMEKVIDGYNLEVLDSNLAVWSQLYKYRDGDTSFNYYGAFHFVPYLEKTDELKRIKQIIAKKCD